MQPPLTLDRAVAGELAPLKLETARFRTAIAPVEAGPSGTDRVEFEVSTNPGAPFGALTRIASGGELSRFILALKVALAEAGSASTMIFDEIDRGVGGAVASAIGERLARLAQDSQVLVVTHSPQVAARATHHYRIEKSHGGEGSRTIGAQAQRRGAARGDCADAVGLGDHRRGAGAGGEAAGGGVTSYVALLRAVNVGGRQLKMDELRRIAGELGLENPRTFIASGNLLFASGKGEAALKRELEAAIADAYGQAGRRDDPHGRRDGAGGRGQSLRRPAGQSGGRDLPRRGAARRTRWIARRMSPTSGWRSGGARFTSIIRAARASRSCGSRRRRPGRRAT